MSINYSSRKNRFSVFYEIDRMTFKSPSILIAEDELLTLKMLTYRLQKEGFAVQSASDGKQALELLSQSKPDIVLTDLIMPHHTGIEVLKYVKEQVSKEIPVLVLSGLGQESTVTEAMNLGAAGYLEKPVNPNDLIHMIKNFFQEEYS